MDLQKQNSPKRHMSIIWLMIVLLIAAFAASIIISGIMFSRATRENREKIICKTAKLVAGQVDGYRTAASQSIPVEDGMQITFHAMSLPTARLVWHCPFLNVFGADDGKVFGENYHDYMLVRLDGECWEGDPGCTVTSDNSRNSASQAQCLRGAIRFFTF